MGTITHAATKAGINRKTHYNWLESDPEYAARFKEADEEATDNLEREARRRAVEGVDEPVFYQGDIVGHIRKMSDTLLIFLLKGAKPEKYRERFEHTGRAVLETPVTVYQIPDGMTDYMNRFGLGAVQVAEWAVTAYQSIKLGLISLAQTVVATNPGLMFNKSLKDSLKQMEADTKASFTSQMNTLTALNERMKKSIEDSHANQNKAAGNAMAGALGGGGGAGGATGGGAGKSFVDKFLNELRGIPKTANEIARAVRESWDKGLERAGYAPGIATEFGGVTNVTGKAGNVPLEMPGIAQWIPDATEEYWKNAPLTAEEIKIRAKQAKEEQNKAAESASRWAAALQGVALMAGMLPGKFGESLTVVANIGAAFKDWNKKDANGNNVMDQNAKLGAAGMAVGQIGGLIGGRTGGVLQGAGGGMAAGSAFGPWGAAIGGILGGIGGLFGGNSARKKELADTKAQLEGMRETAQKLGIDLSKAFSSKNINEVKSAIEAVNKAAADKEKRTAGLAMAAGGLNAFVGGGAVTDQASADRSGLYATAIFGSMVKDTGDVAAALQAISPALSELAKKAEEMGLSLGEGVSNLIGMNNVLSQNEGLAAQVSGLNQMMKGLADANVMNKDLFAALGADATAVFNQLIAGGASGNQALALMQPTLQQLYEGQKDHGYAVDETTQKLLDEAKAQGLVGDSFMSANKQMVDLLKILILAVGGELPDAYKRAGDAAEDYGRRASNSLPNGPRDPFQETPPLDPSSGGANGIAFRNYGSGTRTTLHGEEAVLTRPQVDRLVSMAVSGESAGPRGGGGRPIVIHLTQTLDGRAFASSMARVMETGGAEAYELRNAIEGRR